MAERRLVDARGMRCPWPALRCARAMRDGAALTLVADDARADDEARALAGVHGWDAGPARDAGGGAIAIDLDPPGNSDRRIL